MILDPEQLEEKVKHWHSQGLKIVLTNGCYDLLHLGHLRTFNEAKKLGDLLIVGVNSDASVRLLKGPDRPITPEAERLELVAALKPVDYAILFNDVTASSLIEVIQPLVYLKGGDYSMATLPEKEVLLRLGVEVKIVPLIAGISTTGIINKLALQSTNDPE